MRVTFGHRSEEGAVAVVVALGLIVIFGMTALVIDVGGLLTAKRTMVSAADSAALAAAQSCALGKGFEATTQANALAQENVPSATQLAAPTYTGCTSGSSSGSVEVSYTMMKDLAFAPVLGLPDETDVPATAKAIWGPASGGVGVPLQVNAAADGSFPCTTSATTCNIYFDNRFSTSSSSDWGFLSFDTSNGGWPTSVAGNNPSRACPANGTNDIRDWITGPGVHVQLVQDPSVGPTYVCARDGNMGSGSGPMFSILQAQVGKTFLFPVNRPPMIETNGREKYAIVGFIPLKVTAVYAGNDDATFGTPEQNGVCAGSFTFTEPRGGRNPDPGISTFDAGAQLYDPCVIAHPAATVTTTPTVYCGNSVNGDVATPGTDYTWNAITRIVTWLFPNKPCGKNGGNNTATISFPWNQPRVPGACPQATASDPNAFCMITEFAGPLVAGTNPNPGGIDFGTRAIRLSE